MSFERSPVEYGSEPPHPRFGDPVAPPQPDPPPLPVSDAVDAVARTQAAQREARRRCAVADEEARRASRALADCMRAAGAAQEGLVRSLAAEDAAEQQLMGTADSRGYEASDHAQAPG